MASIKEWRRADGKIVYQVRVRRRGHKPACATFTRKTDAQCWIHETENAVRDGRYFERQEAKKHTLKESIER
jgi:hypothetical protein